MSGRLAPFLRFLVSLRGHLSSTISFEQACRRLEQRLEEREQTFGRILERCVYGVPSSPYLPLLRQAGCGLADALEGIRRWGIEGLLQRWRRDGVWISFGEFKGRAPLVRGAVELDIAGSDFDNPFVSARCEVSTGGSSGRAMRTYLDMEHLAERAVYDALFFRMLDMDGVPIALWYPGLPATTGVANSLRYARIGHVAERWFEMRVDGRSTPGFLNRVATDAMVLASYVSRSPLAWPHPTPLDRLDDVLEWALDARERHGRSAVQSYVSHAVRIAQAATDRGIDLTGVQFIVGSEPFTEARCRAIRQSGADVFSRYHSTELGTMGTGCGTPTEAGDLHLTSDSVTAIQAEEDPDDGLGRRFYFTALLETAPKVMINVQMGDAGVLEERPCGCLLGKLGLTTHMRSVHSVERATVEGMSVPLAELTRAAEEVLAERCGAAALGFQWVERVGADALTRLYLLVHPDLGELDESAVVGDILRRLRRHGSGGRVHAGVWEQTHTLRVLREPPRPTSRGKVLPFLREQTPQELDNVGT